jgi:flagellar L-ring protein precursor FlgH
MKSMHALAIGSMHALALAVAATIAFAGCAGHIAPYHAKHREFDPGEYPPAAKADGGSLYAVAATGLFDDDRGRRVGDLVIIQVDENDSASHDSTTHLGSKNAMNLGAAGGLAAAIKDLSPKDFSSVGVNSDRSFDGNGSIERKGKLTATLPVRVRKVLPNGDLFVEGTKVVMIGDEEKHLYVSGIVRRVDIRGDGSVSSSAVADAEIEYTGRGDASDQQRPGWLSRVLGKVLPF